LLKPVSSVIRGWRAFAAEPPALEIVGRGFRPPAKRFDAFSAAAVQIAAVQRHWRGIRIAASSRERDDATLPKI
jgi:hypothetical protein